MFGFLDLGFLFRVSGLRLGCRVQGLGIKVKGLGYLVWGPGSKVSGFGFQVAGFGFRFQDAGRGGLRLAG